ncbi:MAG: RNA methyltransferase [Pseudomonadota bacterium]
MKRSPRNRPQQDTGAPIWIWGSHAVSAALANPARQIETVLATENAARRLGVETAEHATAKAIDHALPSGAVHQGIAARVHPLPGLTLDELIERQPRVVAILDQVSDPHNLGAIMRSAAAFNIEGIVLQTRHTPAITGIVAKSAAGAVETVPEVRVVNIARSIGSLQTVGYTAVGLAGGSGSSQTLSKAVDAAMEKGGRIALVLGAEGAGLRPAVAKACAILAGIPIAETMESLNVSNAAAIAFYETAQALRGQADEN